MMNELVSREKLAAILQVHPRTISRSIERQGLGRPLYAANGGAMFDPDILCNGLHMPRKFLREVMAGRDIPLNPKEAAAILGLSLIDLSDRVKRRGEPSPVVTMAAGSQGARTTKRYSRNQVVKLAEQDKLLRTVSILKAHAAKARRAVQ